MSIEKYFLFNTFKKIELFLIYIKPSKTSNMKTLDRSMKKNKQMTTLAMLLFKTKMKVKKMYGEKLKYNIAFKYIAISV